jgi:hypothetical protein
LTPAAATFTNTSPEASAGSGRSCGTSISGPPGALIAMTVMLEGNADMVGSEVALEIGRGASI